MTERSSSGSSAEPSGAEDVSEENGVLEEDPFLSSENDALSEQPLDEGYLARDAQRRRFVGQVVKDTWRLVEPYRSQGGQGYLYRGQHIRLGTWFAIKLLPTELGSDLAWRRFDHEAQVTATLGEESEHIVRVLDKGEHRGMPFYVMPALRGVTLREYIPSDGLVLEEALTILRGVLRGLATAHERDVIHRDLKPENIFVETRGDHAHPWILDFGIARSQEHATTTVTGGAATSGTPLYLAPEYFTSHGTKPSKQADIYAVGMVAYEMLVGQNPWRDIPWAAVVGRYQAGVELEPLHTTDLGQAAGVPEPLSAVVAKALSNDPAQRYPDATSMLRAFETACTFDPRRLVGTRLKDRFRIERELGRGGMGVVYAAFDESRNERVAIKFAAPDPAHGDAGAAVIFQRFDHECEAHSAARGHPHIVVIRDKDRAEGFPYCVMDYVDGISFREFVGKTWTDDGAGWLAVVEALQQVAEALDHAHGQGVIHRDVKPSNIVMAREGSHATLVDFGLARAGASFQTRTGQALGTPGYQAPELLAGVKDQTGPASDQWALAAIAYRLLTGLRPGASRDPQAGGPGYEDVNVAKAAILGVAEARGANDLPARLERSVMRGLSHAPKERFPSCKALTNAIKAASAGATIGPPARRPSNEGSAAAPIAAPSEHPASARTTPTPRRRRAVIVATMLTAGVAALAVALSTQRSAPVTINAQTPSERTQTTVGEAGRSAPAPRSLASAAMPDGIETSEQAPAPTATPSIDAGAAGATLPLTITTTRNGTPRTGVAVRIDGKRVQTPFELRASPGQSFAVELVDRRFRRDRATCVATIDTDTCEIPLRRRPALGTRPADDDDDDAAAVEPDARPLMIYVGRKKTADEQPAAPAPAE
jgi:serine/threonine-protein kinase